MRQPRPPALMRQHDQVETRQTVPAIFGAFYNVPFVRVKFNPEPTSPPSCEVGMRLLTLSFGHRASPRFLHGSFAPRQLRRSQRKGFYHGIE